MIANTNESIMQHCSERLRRRLDLNTLPGLSLQIRQFAGPDRAGRYSLQDHGGQVTEPAEEWCDGGFFQKVKGRFRDEYPQLYKDTDWQYPLSPLLIEPIISFGDPVMRISTGINWLVIGVLKNAEKYCAVLDVEVRPLFRQCGLAGLMKQMEIELAFERSCDFIQTWHWHLNPDFNAAIIPGLRSGFVLFRGFPGDGEYYEDSGHIHLRYYFAQAQNRRSRVWFKNGSIFTSPDDNEAIVRHLTGHGKYAGAAIKRIDRLDQNESFRRFNRVTEVAVDPDRRVHAYPAEYR